MQFYGKSAIVTGGASGIGRECARQLHARGANVLLADRNAEALEKTHRSFADDVHRVRSAVIEVTQRQDVERMLQIVLTSFHRVDILIHSAGIGIERSFLETTDEEWHHLLDVDLTGTFLCSQVVGRAMASQRCGRIVTLASTAGIRGGTGRAAYGAAKGGVIALTKVMAVELAPFGVAVNALAPGAIETEMVSKMHSQQTREVYTSNIPMGRYGSVAESANAALFLASDLAKYITGHVLAVDGGFLAAGVTYKHRESTAVTNI